MSAAGLLEKTPMNLFTDLPKYQTRIESGDVHVWHASVSEHLEQLAFLRQVLSHDETSRADRFVFEEDRQRYIIARGLLRVILGVYLEFPPEELVFEYGDYGKPQLKWSARTHPSVCFNLSHASDLVVYALTYEGAVGIDVERIRAFDNASHIVDRYFAENEKTVFQQLSRHRKAEVFFHSWTRKEAIIKALGTGMSYPMDRFTITLLPEEPMQLLHIDDPCYHSTEWSMTEFIPRQGYVGAVAIQSRDASFHHKKWVHP